MASEVWFNLLMLNKRILCNN